MKRFLPARKLSYYNSYYPTKIKKALKTIKHKHTTRHNKHSSKRSHHHNNIMIMENGVGTKLLLMRNRNETETASLYFFFKVGSKNEPAEVMGISHFIEHMIFKGSPRYPSYLDISKTFDSNGISFNAYTSKDMTAYHYKFLATTENVELICKITADMIFHPLMREKDIDNERNVIIQEMKDDEDDIDEWINDKIECSILAGHPLENPIIGNLKTLKNTGRKELLEYHKKYYTPDNLVIALNGNIKSDFFNIINNNFSNSNSNSHSNSHSHSHSRGMYRFKPMKPIIQREAHLIPYVDKNVSSTVECYSKNLNQDYLHLIFKTRGIYDPMKNHYKLLAKVLGGNMSSRLFVKIREQLGLVYSINCSMTNYEEVGYFCISTQNEFHTTLQCLKQIFLELDKIKKTGISEEELKDNKKNYIDTFRTNFDDIEYENEYYGKQILFNLPLESAQIRIDKISKITKAELDNVARELFNYDKLHIITFGKIKKHDITKLLTSRSSNII